VQQKVIIAEPIKIRFGKLLILPTYDFNLNNMQSMVISITCQSQGMVPKRLASRRSVSKQHCPNGGDQMSCTHVTKNVW